MATPTVYLVSGASRGIGLGLVTDLATRPDTIVFAGARNPTGATALTALMQAHPGKVHVVQLTSGDRAENDTAVKEIGRVAGRLDVVIANAGISNYDGPTMDTPEEQLRDHYEVNVIGTHVLLCATYPLLAASTPAPKFVAISSMGGSIAQGTPIPKGMLAYGASKAALNYLMRKVHFEYPGLICFPMCPGAVATERVLSRGLEPELMKKYGMRSVAESAAAILTVVVEATREKDGGRFVNHDGTTLEW
ncbi:NAD(P)-binding protein [Athelia psychrophila]|uniref:NAD(P)-binding protein n=1 Tax=Athelia psychrophila TaxID=1759441 RepID=A0A166EA13_9AGAM|nr:NAD(P)-binding protein [Fibularhizoctonia sp. CBS 109695]